MIRFSALVLAVACSSTPPLDATPSSGAPVTAAVPPATSGVVDARRRDRDYWVPRTDAELDAAFEATCRASEASGKPVLLAFSAPWCPDCRRMRDLSADEPLAGELAHWETLVVDPGRFDRHVPVLEAFEVAKIVTWVAARPQDCRLPAPSWTRLRQGVFEPKTGQPWSAVDLAGWLAEARTGPGSER